MTTSNCPITRLLSCPVTVFGGVIAISITALAAALASEVFLGLEPCKLCIYQRWGFVAAGMLAAIGLFMRKSPAWSPRMALLTAIAFAVNAAVALYHTGVEKKWWVSQVEGCIVTDFGTEPDSILANIMAAPTAPCDTIPWADPLLGLSMANYNVILCAGMALVMIAAAFALRTKKA